MFASYHARVQAGDAHLRARRYAAAAEAYAAAREREKQMRDFDVRALARPEALHNNEAIAAAKIGHRGAAVAAARTAVAADPGSPVFLATEGYALRSAGHLGEAERAYRAAVRADPTAYTVWNDLGVVLARRGRFDDAVRAFRRAVGVHEDYTVGWFNLGVVHGRRGLTHALASQGSLGRAFAADDGLRDRDRERELIPDDAVHFTDLDLSKPLPPRWSFASTQQHAPVSAAGLVLLVLLGLRLGRSLLARGFGGDLVGRLVDPLMRVIQRFPAVPLFTPWLVAVVALIVIVVRGRILAARRAGVRLGRRGWTPGFALAAAASSVGTAWAPLPVAEPSEPAPDVHWIGPVLVGIAALGLLVLGVAQHARHAGAGLGGDRDDGLAVDAHQAARRRLRRDRHRRCRGRPGAGRGRPLLRARRRLVRRVRSGRRRGRRR